MAEHKPPLESPLALWSVAGVLAACATAVLYAARPGINWAISTVTVSLGFIIFLGRADKRWRLNIVTPLALACLIASAAAVTSNPFNAAVIAASVLFSLGAAVLAAHVNSTLPEGPITSVVAAPIASLLAVAEAGRRFADATGALREGRGVPVPVIRGVAIAAPVTLLLALLLCAADPTFAAGRDFIERAFREFSILPRTVFFSVLTVCLVGGFGIALHEAAGNNEAAGKHTPNPARRMQRELLGYTEAWIILASIAALFALFLVLQASYLFGNPGGRTGSGVSYADAVHRGFAELSVAATVCCVLLLALRLCARRNPDPRWPRALEWVVTLQAQILLVSAFYRVDLYESVYGFTRLRVYVQAYALVAFVALILLAAELRAYPSVDRFLRRVMVVAALVFAGLVFGNSDAWIARANLARHELTGQIDVRYLTYGLGPDAVPELVATLPYLPRALSGDIEMSLRQRYGNRTNRGEVRWFEWSLRRAALDRALTRLELDHTSAAVQPLPHQLR